MSFLEDRARFRASTGDTVVTCTPPLPAFEHYCESQLGLGAVTWLRSSTSANPIRVAAACWTDRQIRRTLVGALRSGNLRYIHPHMGNFPVWAIAFLLRRASRRPLQVIGPPPNLTQRVNDKLWFARTVRRMFGDGAVPRTAAAHGFTTAARIVHRLASISRSIVIKVPDAAGGAGNVVLPARRFRTRALGEIRRDLRRVLNRLDWKGEHALLLGSWETDVHSAPSTQLWIPPEAQGLPIVEGVFEQVLEGPGGAYVGCTAAQLPADLTEKLVNASWLLGRVFQRLGYIGRCSFDLLLVGETIGSCHVEIVECNGRWGGTSMPMTLMNRLFDDWAQHPYAVHQCVHPGMSRLSFGELLDFFAGDLYDAATQRGHLILYNPGALQARPGIDMLVTADTWEIASRRAQVEIPRRLRELTRSTSIRMGGWGQIR